MPNIVLVGYESSEGFGPRIGQILFECDCDDEAIITRLDEVVTESVADGLGLSSPYIVVRDTDYVRANKIAVLLNEKLNEDVEVEVLAGFYAKKQINF